MKHNNIRSFNSLLQNCPTISKLYHKLQQIQQLDQLVTKLLPPAAAQNCSVSNLRDGTLVLTTHSPAWHHQINFLKMDLLDQLRSSAPEWAGITKIKVKNTYLIEDLNNYTQPTTSENIPKKLNISAASAAVINRIAETEISYQPLANMLKKLCNIY